MTTTDKPTERVDPRPEDTGAVGKPVDRVDGRLKVTGTARYAAEFDPPGLAYAAVVRSGIPAGRITAIDTGEAEQAPGVILVLTHLNAEKLPYHDAEERPAVLPVSGDRLHVLQNAEVKFSGQPIALVVAETQGQAEYGATLVRAAYERDPLPRTVFDPELGVPASEAAAQRGRGPETRHGDPDAALASAEVRVEGIYVQPREHHSAMEPHATVAMWEGDRLTLWDKSQWVQNVAEETALTFGVPSENVRVINPYVGGAFGSALRPWPHVTLAALGARQSGRPVRLELARRQLTEMIGFRAHAEQRVALGADRDGRLVSLIHEAVAQTSTYEEFAEATLSVPNTTYACQNRRTQYRLVPMNVNTPTPMRGPGWATGLLAQEIAMDELAVALGMDPIELRLRNYAERNPTTDKPWASNELRACYRMGAERFDWSRRSPEPRSMRAGRELVGLGMATAIYPAGSYPTRASATLFADGNAVVRCATTDMGPGTYTSVAQVAADALGLPLERVRFELGDSALPKAMEHGGSTTMASVGSATHEACRTLRAKLADVAGEQTHDASDLAAVLRRAGLDRLDAEAGSEPGNVATTHSNHGFGAIFAEVRVDPDLDTVTVPQIIGAYDAGRVVNPKLAHSQVVGGMVGGIGMAMMEKVDWDPRYGRAMSANLAEYHVPVNANVSELDVIFVPGDNSIANPLGVKGVAELGLCGVAPALANAVWHATGKRVRELPITPDKLLVA